MVLVEKGGANGGDSEFEASKDDISDYDDASSELELEEGLPLRD